MLKKQLSSSVSIPEIDSLYQTILNCGATGGKLLGAGGGGFILFHGSLDVRQRISQALPDNQMLPLKVERNSTRIIFDSSNLE